MNKISYKEVPNCYLYCIQSDCPMADHCLRQMAMHVITKRDTIINIVNPLLTLPSEQCEYFRSDEPQIFARGFEQMQDEMLPRQYKVFMSRLKGKFGRTGYFDRRRGSKLCSPDDINFIESVLKDLGLPNLGFDAYEQLYNWDD